MHTPEMAATTNATCAPFSSSCTATDFSCDYAKQGKVGPGEMRRRVTACGPRSDPSLRAAGMAAAGGTARQKSTSSTSRQTTY